MNCRAADPDALEMYKQVAINHFNQGELDDATVEEFSK